MKTLACCRRRPQDFSIDMDQEPDSKHHTSSPFLHSCHFWFQILMCMLVFLVLFLCMVVPHCSVLGQFVFVN